MKKQTGGREIIFVQVHSAGQYVLSSGIEFPEFLASIPRPLPYLLLLRHSYKDGNFNMHTLLDFVDSEGAKNLATDDVYSYGDFCWLDFEDEENLNRLSGQEMAELLYLGHHKDHLRLPFYGKLQNKFVYLAHDDGWYNKTYYQSWEDFFDMLGSAIVNKINGRKERAFFSRWKKKDYPPVPAQILHSFIGHMKEGIVFSLEEVSKSRNQLEIPIWVIGDFYDMDLMYEQFEMLKEEPCHGTIVFDKKISEWQAYTNGTVR